MPNISVAASPDTRAVCHKNLMTPAATTARPGHLRADELIGDLEITSRLGVRQ
jgi:hypothetical protein